MTNRERERAIDTGYYKGVDLDAESYTAVALEKVEDGYVLRLKDRDQVFDIELGSALLSRLLRSLRAHRLDEIDRLEKLQEAPAVTGLPQDN